MTIDTCQAAADTAFVLLCGTAYVVAANTNLGGAWLIAAVAVIFAAYSALVLARRGESLSDFGLRVDNLVPACRTVGTWTGGGVVSILFYALLTGAEFRTELLIMLPLYPLWGIVQQLIFQGLLHRRILVLVRNEHAAVLLTAMAFALVHLGSWPLVALTFVAGLVWSRLFQVYPNVWALGLSHGILAALAYPLLLADNPLSRM